MTVEMLDDFLIARPRKQTDTDQAALDRGRHEDELFDKFLRELGILKPISKDQPATFTTN